MAKAVFLIGILALLCAAQAPASAAGRVYDTNNVALVLSSNDTAVSPRPLLYPRSRAALIQRRASPIVIDRFESCNYAARTKYPDATTPADGFPAPVDCWAHRWNSGLQTNY